MLSEGNYGVGLKLSSYILGRLWKWGGNEKIIVEPAYIHKSYPTFIHITHFSLKLKRFQNRTI